MTDASITTTPELIPWWKRIGRILLWLGALALLFFVLNALGISISSWLKSLWDTMKQISVGYIIAACFFQTFQTAFTAFAWFAILRAAFTDVKLSYWPILTAYTVSVAMNGVLPANLGTLCLFFIFIAIIPGANFPNIFAGYLVEKIFFTVIGAFVYLYLFVSVPGSASIQLGNVTEHKGLAALIIAGDRSRHRRPLSPRLALDQEALEPGEAGRRDPADAAQVLHAGLLPLVPQLALQARGDRGLLRGLRDPGHLPQHHGRDGRQLARQRHLGHARRRRRQPGDQHRHAGEPGRPRHDRDRLLDLPAADHDGLEHRHGDRARVHLLGLDGR